MFSRSALQGTVLFCHWGVKETTIKATQPWAVEGSDKKRRLRKLSRESEGLMPAGGGRGGAVLIYSSPWAAALLPPKQKRCSFSDMSTLFFWSCQLSIFFVFIEFYCKGILLPPMPKNNASHIFILTSVSFIKRVVHCSPNSGKNILKSIHKICYTHWCLVPLFFFYIGSYSSRVQR